VPHRTNIVILGDFNIDLSTPSAGATNYKSILHINNLSNIIVDHFTDSSNTLIDHILISDTSKITLSGTYDAYLSDHKLIYAVVNLRKPPKPPIFKTIRNYKDVDWEVVKREFQQTPWWITTTFDNINDTCWAWQKLYDEIINKHIKSRRVKIKAQTHPWMNSDIRKQMNRRYKLLKTAQKTEKGSREWTLYKQARNHCTALFRKAKCQYWKEKFDNSNSTKEFWSLVKAFQCKQTKSK